MVASELRLRCVKIMGKKSTKEKKIQRRNRVFAKREKKRAANLELVQKILLYDAPELYLPSTELTKDDDMEFIGTLMDVLCATSNGVGMAACQIGVNKRVCALRINTKLNAIKLLINPEIVEESENRFVTGEEGCLSFPGIVSEIQRPYSIKVKYLDENFEEHIEDFEGFESKVIGHEIDHMNGECVIGEIWRQRQNSEETLVEKTKE
jgi:peptide deformylase